MYEYIFSLIILILAIPVAYILARITKDELRKRRKFFIGFMVFFLILAILSLIFRFESWQAILFTSIFMVLLELMLLRFSSRKMPHKSK